MQRTELAVSTDEIYFVIISKISSVDVMNELCPRILELVSIG